MMDRLKDRWINLNKWKNENYPKTTGVFTSQDQYAFPVTKDFDNAPEVYSKVSDLKFLKWTVGLPISQPCH